LIPDCWRSYKESMFANIELCFRNKTLLGNGRSKSGAHESSVDSADSSRLLCVFVNIMPRKALSKIYKVSKANVGGK